MKICITAQGDNLDVQVESRFGRSPYFIIYETETANYEAIKNPNVDAASGVGIQSAQLVADKKVGVILTGDVGPKASKVLDAAAIKVIKVGAGSVKEMIDQYVKDMISSEVNEHVKANDLPTEKQKVQQPGNWLGRVCRRMLGGQRTNVGSGLGRGRGQGQGRQGAAGRSGYCICPNCGEKLAHQAGLPCRANNCPQCGAMMVRE